MAEVIRINQFTELARLKASKGYSDLKKLFERGTLTIRENKVESEELYQFLKDSNVDARFLEKNGDSFCVDKCMVQLILIDSLLIDQLQEYGIKEVAEAVRQLSEKHKSLLYWNDSGLVMAYLQEFGLKNWNEFVSEATMDWNNFNALTKAMSLISLGVEELILFFQKVLSTEALQSSTHQVSQIFSDKLKNDMALAAEFDGKIEDIISDDKLRRFIPAIIIGIINSDVSRFQTLLDRLKDNYEGTVLFELFWGFLRCCPSEKTSSFEKLIYDKFVAGKLSKPQYLQLSGQFRTVSPNIVRLVTEQMGDDDFVGVYDYLYELAASHSKEDWYKTAVVPLYCVENAAYKSQLDFMLYVLSGHNLELIYELLTARFEKLGANLFIRSNLPHIIDLDRDLFQLNLTKWLNSENINVHKALLRLCSGEISAKVTKVSGQYFKTLSDQDKVYICFKIAGFVYSMEHLQSLLFSVLDAAEVGDDALFANLYVVFRDYLVYNYRSTLDQIRERLADKKCSGQHRQFLQPIVDDFEHYFAQLNTVRTFNEFRADSKLEDFIRFYKSQLFSASMSKENQKGFLSMVKSIELHAKKWAIRRPNEKIHQVSPLGLIQHSIEFPSGEKLNPTYHESIRRNYQIIQKHEINFS